jgi:hypothetical protein
MKFLFEHFNNNKVFITFGASPAKGSKYNYQEASDRIKNQAYGLNIFDKIIAYSDTDLKKDSEFWNKHSNFIESNNRGYGYWLWKPYLIMKTLDTMNDGDILLYSDCGCELDIKNINQFHNLFDLVKKDLIVGGYMMTEKNYTKMDLVMHLNMNNDKYLSTQQHIAGSICILKCKKTVDLIREWYDISCNYNLLNDTPSSTLNYASFKEHRHDQSIFSLLTKKYDIYGKYDIRDTVTCNWNRTGKSRLN